MCTNKLTECSCEPLRLERSFSEILCQQCEQLRYASPAPHSLMDGSFYTHLVKQMQVKILETCSRKVFIPVLFSGRGRTRHLNEMLKSFWFFTLCYKTVLFTATRQNLYVVSITLFPHKAELLCLPAAHEVAALISGSRWRASKWEAQSGSMYVISKRMTLASSQQRFNQKKHAVSVLFCPSICMSVSLPLSHTHTHRHTQTYSNTAVCPRRTHVVLYRVVHEEGGPRS